eukprot:scaffold31169_cov33-Phaeocystis_antarctica.AAC.1
MKRGGHGRRARPVAREQQVRLLRGRSGAGRVRFGGNHQKDAARKDVTTNLPLSRRFDAT